jgi:Fic family protein
MLNKTSNEQVRCGQYADQVGGYKAFIPRNLPPNPSVQIDGEMHTLLSKADRALGRLDGSIQTLPDPDLFVFMYVRKEAVLSSQIEGTQSSLNDVLEVEAKVFDKEHPRDVSEVLNYVFAMNYGLDRLAQLPLSVRLIREFHERLMKGVRGKDKRPGEIRREQNWIGPSGSSIKEATFVPPPPDTVPDALAGLEKFLHEETPDIPPLVKIGLAHAQFETIHPFLDGNGRIGRLLITFFLCEQKILMRPVLYISHYFRRHQNRYYDLLQSTRDHGDWESWLKFFLSGIAIVSNEATETARRIVALREDHRRLILEDFGRAAGNGLTMLEYLYQRPIIQVKEIAELLDISYAGANSLVGRLAASGLLTEVTGQARNRRFRYGGYIDLFTDVQPVKV